MMTVLFPQFGMIHHLLAALSTSPRQQLQISAYYYPFFSQKQGHSHSHMRLSLLIRL